MSGYSTIEMAGEVHQKSNQKFVIAVACLVGLVAGFVVTSTSVSLFTRTVQTVQTPVYALSSRRQAEAPLSATNPATASVQPSAIEIPAANAFQSPSTSLVSLLLAASAAAIAGWGLGRIMAPRKVAVMTTTSVKREWAAQSGKKYKGVQPIIAPSLLAADLANLAADSKRVLEAGADVLHVDVMDGHFVPNLSWGAPVIKCLRQHSNAFFDTHLMVSNPEDFIAPMADAGVDLFTFHIEAAKDPKALIKAIKAAGMKVGISVKPKTPVETVFPYVNDVDLILVMTVEPGFGGQSFMEDMMPKVKLLREKYPNLQIEVDGGLSPKTIDSAAKAGANAIVAGSACFVADPKGAIDAMRASVEKYCTGPGM